MREKGIGWNKFFLTHGRPKGYAVGECRRGERRTASCITRQSCAGSEQLNPVLLDEESRVIIL